jgi:hypothetical protein
LDITEQRRLSMHGTKKRLLASRTVVVLSLVAAFLLMVPRPAVSQYLHGTDNEGRMFFINLATGAGAFLCNLPVHPDPGVTELEFDFNTMRGVIQSRDGIFTNQIVDIFNCASFAGEVFNGWAFNGLEFVDGVLYGAAILNTCEPSQFMILNPNTGATTLIGPTGMGPISGLAWNGFHGVMYGVTGCEGVYGLSLLVTIDMSTGAATVVGPTGISAGSLEWGPNGRLYAGGNRRDGGNLYEIDPYTGAATLVGWTGFESVTGLAFAQFPVPVEEVTWGAIKAMYEE